MTRIAEAHTLFFKQNTKGNNFIFYSNIKLLLYVLNLICCLTASAKWRESLTFQLFSLYVNNSS